MWMFVVGKGHVWYQGDRQGRSGDENRHLWIWNSSHCTTPACQSRPSNRGSLTRGNDGTVTAPYLSAVRTSDPQLLTEPTTLKGLSMWKTFWDLHTHMLYPAEHPSTLTDTQLAMTRGKSSEERALGQAGLGSVGGRKETWQVEWKKRLGLNAGQGETLWRTDCSLWEEGRQLRPRAEEERKRSHVQGSVSHFLTTKTKPRQKRHIYELGHYHGLTYGYQLSILSIGLTGKLGMFTDMLRK